MPDKIVEGALTLEFDGSWNDVIKWDDSAAYQNGIRNLTGSRAVDIVAYNSTTKRLVFIEIKDPSRHRIENRHRLTTGDLFDEVGWKVADTVAGMRGATRTADDNQVKRLSARVASQDELLVVLWLDEAHNASATPSSTQQKRRKSRLGTLTQELKRRVRWLTTKALVVSHSTGGLSMHGISSLRKTR